MTLIAAVFNISASFASCSKLGGQAWESLCCDCTACVFVD